MIKTTADIYMKNVIPLFFLIILTVFLSSCESDDSNPVAPSYVGEYSGTNSLGKHVSFTISNKAGRGFVTQYLIVYEYEYGNFLVTDSTYQSNSEGITEVLGAKYKINLSDDPEEYIDGTVKSSSLEGTFSVYTGLSNGSGGKVYAVGTYTADKE